MARNDGIDRTTVRNQSRTESNIADAEAHNERLKTCYRNEDIIPKRSHLNIHFKEPTGSYQEMFSQMEQDSTISTRGLKPDAVHYDELVFDVNSAYFHNHGGYEYAQTFYAEAYKAAVDIVGGEQYILSAVMHADERNAGMSKALGYDVWHYHLHVIYVPVVEKQVLWSKRCKDPLLIGTVKETIMQVSHSKKWQSQPVFDESGKTMHTKNGKIVLKKSYSVLQDQYHDHMVSAGFTDVERGERGSTEEHLSTVQFKVMKEQANLDSLLVQQQAAEQSAQLAQTQCRKAEHDIETAQKKLDGLVKNTKDIETFVQRLGSSEELLPDVSVLESGKSYRANKALPVVKKLVRRLKEVYVLLVNERHANSNLAKESVFWLRKAETNAAYREDAVKLNKLNQLLGKDEIDRLLSQCKTPERHPLKSKEHDLS